MRLCRSIVRFARREDDRWVTGHRATIRPVGLPAQGKISGSCKGERRAAVGGPNAVQLPTVQKHAREAAGGGSPGDLPNPGSNESVGAVVFGGSPFETAIVRVGDAAVVREHRVQIRRAFENV